MTPQGGCPETAGISSMQCLLHHTCPGADHRPPSRCRVVVVEATSIARGEGGAGHVTGAGAACKGASVATSFGAMVAAGSAGPLVSSDEEVDLRDVDLAELMGTPPTRRGRQQGLGMSPLRICNLAQQRRTSFAVDAPLKEVVWRAMAPWACGLFQPTAWRTPYVTSCVLQRNNCLGMYARCRCRMSCV